MIPIILALFFSKPVNAGTFWERNIIGRDPQEMRELIDEVKQYWPEKSHQILWDLYFTELTKRAPDKRLLLELRREFCGGLLNKG